MMVFAVPGEVKAVDLPCECGKAMSTGAVGHDHLIDGLAKFPRQAIDRARAVVFVVRMGSDQENAGFTHAALLRADFASCSIRRSAAVRIEALSRRLLFLSQSRAALSSMPETAARIPIARLSILLPSIRSSSNNRNAISFRFSA